MRDFIDYLKKENLVARLIEYYKRNLKSKKNRDSLKEAIEQIFNSDKLKDNIHELKKINHSGSNLDLIGKIYEKSLKYEVRKRLGEFYTPLFVVDYILNAVQYNSESYIDDRKLIDISCGSGSFIIQAINILINWF
ncbi:MAG: SAM-dependent DNA methyltransferase, partial [Promethearchaeota archaeon]